MQSHTSTIANTLTIHFVISLVALGIILSSLVTPRSAAAQTQNQSDNLFLTLGNISLLLGEIHESIGGVPVLPPGVVQGAATTTMTPAEITERISYLEKKLAQTDAEIARINAELVVLRAELEAAKAALSDTVPVVVVPPPIAEKRAMYKALTGTYVLSTKDNVTQLEALQNCNAIITANPSKLFGVVGTHKLSQDGSQVPMFSGQVPVVR